MSGVAAKALIQSKYASTSVTTEYTAPVSTRTIIDKFTGTNTDVGAQTLTVHLVPSGGTATAANLIATASLAAGATYNFSSELQNHILSTGDFVAVYASTPSKIVIRMSGRECT
jgi:hypothetical protein